MGFWTAGNQSYAMSVLTAAGLPLYGAAGLVSRWANVESIAAGPTAVNSLGGAFGIAQWRGARRAPINGNTDFDAQLAYAIQELNGPENRAGAVLKSAQDADRGAVGASMYERGEGYSSQTGRDNFTGQTAAGIQGVINSYGGEGASVVALQSPDIQFPASVAGQSISMALLIGIGGLALYLLVRD